MSHIDLIIEERSADIGNFLVGRLLPFRNKRMVGPFIFIDHMGPAALGPGENMDIAPHPHVGLSTLTYLFEGSILHRDSLGTEVEIHPGELNWMTSGSGIAHSERTPEALRHTSKRLHGLQIWVAMPRANEQDSPSFHHTEASDLPQWEHHGATYKLIAGTAFGQQSPVPVLSPLYLIEIHCPNETVIDTGDALFGESALYILEGSVQQDAHTYGSKQILVSKDSKLCQFTAAAGTTLFLFGGDTFPEERFIYWNFVASSQEIIENAKARWEANQFGQVPGETERIPLPQPPASFKPKH